MNDMHVYIYYINSHYVIYWSRMGPGIESITPRVFKRSSAVTKLIANDIGKDDECHVHLMDNHMPEKVAEEFMQYDYKQQQLVKLDHLIAVEPFPDDCSCFRFPMLHNGTSLKMPGWLMGYNQTWYVKLDAKKRILDF